MTAILTLLIGLCALPAIADTHTHTLSVGQFNKINVTDDINVVYRCVADSTGMISFTADESLAKAFIFTNNKGNLRVQINTDMVARPELPTVYLYSDYLTSVENGGRGTLTVESPHPCPEFKATLLGNGRLIVEDITATDVKGVLATGNGTISLGGRCTKASLTMVGTGTIQADRLQAEEVNVTIAGSGTIGCWPVQLLKSKGIGSTKIYYKGHPTIRKSGGGKLFPIEQESQPF